MMNKPDIFVAGASSKGFSLTDPVWLNHFDIDTGIKPDMSVKVAYTDQGWFKRCVDVRANTIVSMPWDIYNSRGEVVWTSGEPAPPGWEWFDIDDYLYRTAASLTLVSAAYAHKEGNANADGRFTRLQSVDGLKWMNPLNIKPEMEKGTYGPDALGNFTHFKREVNGKKYYIPRELVLHTFTPSPFVEQGPGMSEGMAAKVSAQILADLASFESDQLRSGLVKKTVFVADKDARPPDKQQLDKWRRWLTRFLLGAKGTQPEVMQGLDTKEIGSSLSDLHSDVITKDAREAMTTAFGLPHSLVLSNAANFATAQADQVNYYMTTAIPQARTIARPINQQLLADLGFRFAFDPSRLEVFQAAELEKAQAVAALAPGRVFITRQKFQELTGWEYTPEEIAELDAAEAVQPEPAIRSAKRVDNVTQVDVEPDLVAWRRKVKSKGRDVDFSPDYLSDHEASVIRERLMEGKSLDEVFGPPFTGF